MAELSSDDRQYLLKLLDRRRDELLHELHHAFTSDYKHGIKEEIAHVERLRERLGSGA